MSKDHNSLNGNSVLKHSFNPYMSTNIIIFVIISIILMIYAFAALFFGLQPLAVNNPFNITAYTHINALNALLFIINVAVAIGVIMFIYRIERYTRTTSCVRLINIIIINYLISN